MQVFLWIIASIWLVPLATFVGVLGACILSRRCRQFWREHMLGHRRDAEPPLER